MLATREELQATKMPQLKNLIIHLGGDPSGPQETKPNLIDRLIFQMAKQPDAPKMPTDEELKETGFATKKPVEQVETTIEQVLQACNPFILRGLKVYHNEEDKTWLFRVQIKSGQIRDTNTGETRIIERWRDDSGTLRQPLSTIKRCASILMQGALQPAAALEQRNPALHYNLVS